MPHKRSACAQSRYNLDTPKRRNALDGNCSDDPKLAPQSIGLGAHGDLRSSIYQELHRLAVVKMRFERVNHTLQPTALVHEAYLRLSGAKDSEFQDRTRFLRLAAHVMRNILVDHARARRAGKRGGEVVQVTFDEGMNPVRDSPIDVLALDQALTRLSQFDHRQAEILQMRFFAGLTFEEIAMELGLSSRTIKRDWIMARAWLNNELSSVK